MQKITQDEKDEIMLNNTFVNITLNGEPAKIYGRKLDFPVIAQIQGKLKSVFSWDSIKRICMAGGDFEI